MAQETGTLILARARIKAQDNDAAGNFAVNAADALVILNDLLVKLNNNIHTKTKTIAASTSGLTFSSGTISKVTTADINAIEFQSFHQSSSSSLSNPLSPEITRVSVEEILKMFNYDGQTVLGPQGNLWSYVAAEKTQDDTAASGVEVWRVYGFPIINQTWNMHVKAIVPTTIATIGLYPDIDAVDSTILADLMAYELAKLKKETSQQFLDNILKSIPQPVLGMVYGEGVRSRQLQDGFTRVEY